jgi:hypothetical protein
MSDKISIHTTMMVQQRADFKSARATKYTSQPMKATRECCRVILHQSLAEPNNAHLLHKYR